MGWSAFMKSLCRHRYRGRDGFIPEFSLLVFCWRTRDALAECRDGSNASCSGCRHDRGTVARRLFDETLLILVNDVDLSRRVHDVGPVDRRLRRRVMHQGGGSLRQFDRSIQERLCD